MWVLEGIGKDPARLGRQVSHPLPNTLYKMSEVELNARAHFIDTVIYSIYIYSFCRMRFRPKKG